MKKIAVIFGTRPDTIKMAPLIKEIEKEKKHFNLLTIATAQHRQMLDQVLDVFKIIPDYDLNIMQPSQSLAEITKNTITELDNILVKERPDLVLVQGDTTTTFVGSLASFYRNIPVGHIEAGLRTNDKKNPFPEEINRRMTGSIADLHFAPTRTAKNALLSENIDERNIFVTGNTVIDALKYSIKDNHRFTIPVLNDLTRLRKKIILVTTHRRENVGEPMAKACEAIKQIAYIYQNFQIVIPIHLNPEVQKIIHNNLDAINNVHLIQPLDYLDFVNLMAKSHLILTDSGGVQEEGPHFGIPILVLREVTERPEAIQYGTVKLVGSDPYKIFNTADVLLSNEDEYIRMATAINPYGDGKASDRILRIIKHYFNIEYNLIEEFDPDIKKSYSKQFSLIAN